MTQDTRTVRERAVELVRATLATTTWLPDTEAKRLVWAIRGTLVLGLLLLVASVVEKGLWDWLKLLIIPGVLAAGGLWFNRQQRERELEIARQQREQDAKIAESRAQDEALQAYLDQMSSMLIPNTDQPSLYKARPGDGLSSLARARTLTVLPRLDGRRKARVVRFLYESGLLVRGRPVLDLRGADLRGAFLSGVNLRGAFLTGAYLSYADLSYAYLSEADLRGADLKEANLRWTTLSRADLRETNLFEADLLRVGLRGADLRGAFLSRGRLIGANLRGTDLRGAHLDKALLGGAFLSGANLRGAFLSEADLRTAWGWTEAQLSTAKTLSGTIMPDGQTLRNPVRDLDFAERPTFEDWLKDKESRKEDAEND